MTTSLSGPSLRKRGISAGSAVDQRTTKQIYASPLRYRGFEITSRKRAKVQKCDSIKKILSHFLTSALQHFSASALLYFCSFALWHYSCGLAFQYDDAPRICKISVSMNRQPVIWLMYIQGRSLARINGNVPCPAGNPGK